MKLRLYYFVILLLGLLTPSVHGQALTLKEIISLSSQDIITVDSYLTSRGWYFVDVPQKDDSTNVAFWSYDLPSGKTVANAYLLHRFGQKPRFFFSTLNRRAFDIIRGSIDSCGMLRGPQAPVKMDKPSVEYLDEHQAVWLSLSTEKEGNGELTAWYHAYTYQHDLPSGIFSRDGQGALHALWATPRWADLEKEESKKTHP